MTNIVELRSTIEQQAREWLIRLDADEPLSEEEARAFQEWWRRSPLRREELKRISAFLKQATRVLAELAVPLPRRPRRVMRRTWVAVSVASAVLISIAVVFWRLQLADQAATGAYATAIGQQKAVALPDGSSIQLNTDSQVQVNYSHGLRKIRLLRGEALFSVAHDPNRAFEVYAADGIVRAVGTAFSVQLEGRTVNVTVTKGVVDVLDLGSISPVPVNGPAPPERPQHRLGRLQAGETTTFGSATAHIDVRQLAQPEIQRRLAWHEGYLVFTGEPLSQVVEQVNRYSPVTLEIADPKLSSITIGGRFRVGDLDAVLGVLHDNFGIESRRTDERTIRLEHSSPR
jgi:transmembrane sensor